MINIQNVHKQFENRKKLFNGINLHVFPSTLTVITGKSGSGKTTLLNMIRGDIPPDSGRIVVSGKNINNLSRKSKTLLNRTIAFICQESNLINDRTVIENIALPLRIAGIHGALLRKRVDKLLELTGLEKLSFERSSVLSGGEKRRVLLARSLASSPSILLADEPATGLDPESTNEMISILYSLPYEEGITVVVSTHNPVLLAGLSIHGTFSIEDGNISGVSRKSSRELSYDIERDSI